MSGFVLDLGSLREGAHRLELESAARDLDLPEDEWSGPVRADVNVEKSADRVSVRGMVRSTARFECARCLRAFEAPVEARLEVFADRAGSGRRGDEEALDRDDYMRFHDGRHLDLREDAREALLLEVPITPRCREDCKGLCPRCGADLNEGPCGCAAANEATR